MRVPTGPRPPSPIVSLSLYNGVHASGFREPVYTLTIPGPSAPSRRRPYHSMRLFISLAPSRRLPFVSRFSPRQPPLHRVSPSLSLRLSGTKGQIEF